MKRIVILGAGESGSGAAILAKEKGFDVFVSDCGTISEPYRALLDQNGVAWEDGQHTESLILNADEVVKSPGIPLTLHPHPIPLFITDLPVLCSSFGVKL